MFESGLQSKRNNRTPVLSVFQNNEKFEVMVPEQVKRWSLDVRDIVSQKL